MAVHASDGPNQQTHAKKILRVLCVGICPCIPVSFNQFNRENHNENTLKYEMLQNGHRLDLCWTAFALLLFRQSKFSKFVYISHWVRVTHLCVSQLTIISSGNGLYFGRRRAIIGANAGLLLVGPLGPNFSEILIQFHSIKMHFKMSSGKRRLLFSALVWHTDTSWQIFQSLIEWNSIFYYIRCQNTFKNIHTK